MTPKVLIADDEVLLSQHLARLVNSVWPEAVVVATTSNGIESRNALRQYRPDVAFLDIRMPPPNGLELAEEFCAEMTHIVFVTAYDEYAVKAFEKNACDYLLKPVSEARLRDTVHRLQRKLEGSATASIVASIRDEIEKLKRPPTLARIAVHHQGETKFVRVDEIRFFRSEAKYTLVCDAASEYVVSMSLKALERQLDPNVFCRVHRNCLVNANFIEAAVRADDDSLYLRVVGRSEKLRVSRSYRQLFHEL